MALTTKPLIDVVPIELLDQFYFGEVVGQMPAALQPLAVDLRLLRRAPTVQPIDTLNGLFDDHYLFMPWLLDDIFAVPAEERLIIGQGWLLLMIACVMLDQLVDREMPAQLPLVPLVQQHLLLKSGEIFGRLIPETSSFWPQYRAALYELINALALESAYLDTHTQPYTYEIMQNVCIGKAAPFSLPPSALSLRSQTTEFLPTIRQTFKLLLLVDQLVDDALDWRSDYRAGRYTMPIYLALETLTVPGQIASGPDENVLAGCLEKSGILKDIFERSLSLLEAGRSDLIAAGLGDTKLNSWLAWRIEQVQRCLRYHQASRLLTGVFHLLAQRE